MQKIYGKLNSVNGNLTKGEEKTSYTGLIIAVGLLHLAALFVNALIH